MQKIIKPVVSISTIFMMVFSSFTSFAPTIALAGDVWPSCSFNCTANDVNIVQTWLGDSSGNLLGPCTPGQQVNANIWAKFYNNANQYRYAVILLGKIYVNNSLVKDFYTDNPAGYCSLDNIPGKSYFDANIYSFNWTCGQEVEISNIVVSWEPSSATCATANRSCSARGQSKCKSSSVLFVAAPLVADFLVNNAPQCLNGNSISFTDMTTGGYEPYTYSWDFGDSSSSTLQNPTHSYAAVGTYNVTLTVTDDDMQNTDSQTYSVTINENSICDDGFYCNGAETCSAGQCAAGTNIDCSANNIPGIATCENDPDGNPFTWDWRSAFTSGCNEETDSCNTGNETITHTCDVDQHQCGAKCDAQHSCADTQCGTDGCQGNDYYDYTDVANNCLEDCTCTENQCGEPQVSYNDPACTECQTDDDCNSLDDDYCYGTVIKHDEGRCINYSCIPETTIILDCDNGLACDGQESCSLANCSGGTPVDCSANDITSVATCLNDPDCNPLTWDWRDAFTSQCQEPTGTCSTGNGTITHTCDAQCGGCTSNEGCDDQIQYTIDTCNLTTCQCEHETVPYCGDQICSNGETCETCPGDCGICPPNCGDQTCNGDETCSNCPQDCGTCPPVTINAYKVICQTEADLPNWGDGGPDITATTASDYVSQNQNCQLVSGWNFEWADAGVSNPGDNLIGPTGVPWTIFGPTDVNGLVVTNVNNLSGDRLWLREVMKEGYISFSGSTAEPRNNISAEFYCHTDVLNYDNYDYILNPQLGNTYYCVGFNVPSPQEPVCGDGIKNGNEECDGVDGTPDHYTCTSQCTLEYIPYCGDASCNGSETCETCPGDCGTCQPSCGDQVCNGDETCSTCPSDCGTCPQLTIYGIVFDDLNRNAVLDPGDEPGIGGVLITLDGTATTTTNLNGNYSFLVLTEGNHQVVETDLPAYYSTTPNTVNVATIFGNSYVINFGDAMPSCGDQICNGDETCSTCPSDCGTCPPNCGDQVCNGEETCSNCSQDCGTCPPSCGDQSCNGDETCNTCPSDCGGCPGPGPFCGDGSCSGDETCNTCPSDCGGCPGPGPFCGDGIVNGDEQCDGTAGVTEGFTCTASCVLSGVLGESTCTMDLYSIIVMDVSGSMGYESPSRLSRAKTAANSFIDNLRSNDQSGLVSFSWTATLNKGLSNDHTATKSVINGLVAGGATNISAALDKANQELISVASAPNVAKIEILLTDGRANQPNGDGSVENLLDLALALEKSLQAAENGIRVFTIGLGGNINTTMLQTIANNTSGKYYFAPTGDDLAGIFNQIAAENCKSATYTLPNLAVFNIRAATISNTIANVSWYTNIPATSRVVYDTIPHVSLNEAPNYGYAFSTDEDSNKVIYHEVTITDLSPETNYYWRPISHGSGEVLGEESIFTTTASSELLPSGGETGETPTEEELPQEVLGEVTSGGTEEIVTPVEEEVTSTGQAAIGGFFNPTNIFWIILILAIVAIVLWVFLKNRR